MAMNTCSRCLQPVKASPKSEREAAYKKIMALKDRYLLKHSLDHLGYVMIERYQFPEARLLTTEQLEDLAQYMEQESA